jgi:putative intracellular protease/amidase
MDIVIPLFPNFTALDAVGPYEVLSRLPGAVVTFAAATAEPVTTDTGALTLVPAARFDVIERSDILVVPGGPGTRMLMTDRSLIDWVRHIDAHTQWTTSVCTGSLVLGAAGLLTGLRATTHWAARDLLESLGAEYTEERVVIEGKIVTAAGVSSGIDMALTLAGLVGGTVTAEAIQLSIEYDPQPPYDSGSVAKAEPSTVELVRSLVAQRTADRVG